MFLKALGRVEQRSPDPTARDPFAESRSDDGNCP
jgi:hypothetical protein